MWALLTLYQLLRMAMVDAAETRPGTDPDRASFTTALEAAPGPLTAAAASAPTAPPTCPASSAGRSWLPCCPPGVPAYSARNVKCATSRYLNRDDGRPPPAAITAIDITVCTPPVA